MAAKSAFDLEHLLVTDNMACWLSMEESSSLTPITKTSSTKKKPSGTGRKKIEIKKIENISTRRVAFSKRRRGLFNKAAELCRLCDANIAIVIFSPTGRPFSFGDRVIDQYLREYEETNGKETKESSETNTGEEGFWWEESIEGFSLEELENFKSSLEELRINVAMKLEEMMRRTCERDFLRFM